MADFVTQENNPGLWSSLYAMWVAEGSKTKYVVNGTAQYRVVQDAQSKEIKFLPQSAESLYEHRSFR